MMPKLADLRICCHAKTDEEAYLSAGPITGSVGLWWELAEARRPWWRRLVG